MIWRVFSLFMAALLGLSAAAVAQGRGPASVFVTQADERPFSNRIEALGTLQANERVDLTLNASDRITAIYFEDGQRVKAGQTLLSLAQGEQLALVEASEAELEEARRQLERVGRLSERQAVSVSELDQAQRNMDRASANLRAVQSRQRDRILVAPFDGVLGFRQVSVGTYLRPGDIVATLIDDSRMRMDFSVPSVLLQAVRPGTRILTETDALSGQVFEGAVATVNNVIDPVTRAVRVRAILPNETGDLRPGMFMKVTVQASERTVLAIPEQALQSVGADTFVYRVVTENGAAIARRTRIRLGARHDGYVEVVDGLSRGETIILEGLIRVREGARVVVRSPSLLQPGADAARAGPAGAGR